MHLISVHFYFVFYFFLYPFLCLFHSLPHTFTNTLTLICRVDKCRIVPSASTRRAATSKHAAPCREMNGTANCSNSNTTPPVTTAESITAGTLPSFSHWLQRCLCPIHCLWHYVCDNWIHSYIHSYMFFFCLEGLLVPALPERANIERGYVTPQQVYNLLNAEAGQPALHDPNYILILDCRSAERYRQWWVCLQSDSANHNNNRGIEKSKSTMCFKDLCFIFSTFEWNPHI